MVVVNGDLFEKAIQTKGERGGTALIGIRILKKLGHSVVYVPGNHDGFDWGKKIDASRLVLSHFNWLQKNGIPVLVSNALRPARQLLQGVLDQINKLENS